MTEDLIKRLRSVVDWQDGRSNTLPFPPGLRSREIREAADAIERLSAELAEARKDVERYRWLRRFDHFAIVDAMLDTTEYNTLDSAVDAALASEQPQASAEKT